MEQKKKNSQKNIEKKNYDLQIRISSEMKEKIEEIAQNVGVSINQYVLFMLIKEVQISNITDK